MQARQIPWVRELVRGTVIVTSTLLVSTLTACGDDDPTGLEQTERVGGLWSGPLDTQGTLTLLLIQSRLDPAVRGSGVLSIGDEGMPVEVLSGSVYGHPFVSLVLDAPEVGRFGLIGTRSIRDVGVAAPLEIVGELNGGIFDHEGVLLTKEDTLALD